MSRIAPVTPALVPAAPTAPAVSPVTGRPPASPSSARFEDLLARRAPGVAPLSGSATAPSGVARTPDLLEVLGRAARGVAAAGGRLDGALGQVRRGGLGPDQLLKVQAEVYEAGATLQLASKLVEKATSGIKQVLQTQV